ncbi:MAG: 16S rRNA (guanine(966)-N(2))-methyltransferase RsmD [Limnobacter sp.]|nr:16S rRNA (guanine(966)-N(2))-methyltransferase RsmD [Limnobacter sp.]
MTSTVRIIGGAWRRLHLPIAPVEGLRPSPDRVRETLFNWLGQDCTGWSVLDLFAGTGALGFEAASRGASEVCFVESNKLAAQQLRLNVEKLHQNTSSGKSGDVAPSPAPKLQVQQADVGPWLAQKHSQPQSRFDLVFADPPFRSDWMDKILPHIAKLVQPGGIIYLEWSECLFDQVPRKGVEPTANALADRMKIAKIDALRYLKAGQVHAHLVGIPAL